MFVNYEADKFTRIWGKKLKGHNTLNFSWPEIVHAALMVGKQSYFELSLHGYYSYMEVIYRYSMLKAFILEDSTGGIVKSEVYKDVLDPSEKGAVSYFLGNVFTNLVSIKLLGVKTILHYDQYKHTYSISAIGGCKPDFIAQNYRDEWIVLESKGRSGRKDNIAIDKAKTQLKAIRKINNNIPVVKVAIQTYFTNSGFAKLHIEDPDDSKINSVKLEINHIKFLKRYYKLIIDLFYENSKKVYKVIIQNTVYILINIPEIEIEVGLPEYLFKKLTNNIDIDFKNIQNWDFERTKFFLSRDKVIVIDIRENMKVSFNK
ncbi:hypothetical protein P8610_19555 [Fictibacillus sp. UD]|uniref:hypothetical protein n=1 Tax=Fictibacillus sp. UD TaxID=3038777 RepID=UPI003744C3BA